MKITDEIIDHLAHLARLSFSDDEKEDLKQDLEKMIGFVEKLKEIDTTGVEPLLHISDAENVLREDEVKQTITKQEALLNAPKANDDFFIVPKVIKKNNSN
jgi:aspartyl-tRNA(Asn)/glutamyl-tRNA(Gln) amidotransferase subunit C